MKSKVYLNRKFFTGNHKTDITYLWAAMWVGFKKKALYK